MRLKQELCKIRGSFSSKSLYINVMDQSTQENRPSLYFSLHLCFSIKRAF